MQILYWHLRGPRSSSSSNSSFVHSPPLLQRFPPELLPQVPISDPQEEEEEEEQEEEEMEDQGLMEYNDASSEDPEQGTVFYLDVDQLGGLNLDLNLLAPITTTPEAQFEPNSTTITTQLPNGIDSNSNFEIHQNLNYANSTNNNNINHHHQRMSSSNSGNKRKGSSWNNEFSLNNGCSGGEGGGGSEWGQQNQSHPSILNKRPKLVVNLYEENVGYEFGCLLQGEAENAGVPSKVTHLSHLIPYSEDELLQSVDREELPPTNKLIKEELIWNRGHVIAQIRDYRRFSKGQEGQNNKDMLVSNNNNKKSPLKGSSPGEKKIPSQIRQVLLKPTTQSLLTDFDRLLHQSLKDRKKWRNLNLNPNKIQNQQLFENEEEEEEEEDAGSDSDYELEVDIERSKSPSCDELSYDQRLELEKEFVNKTGGALCLDPNPIVGLISNRAQFERLKLNLDKKTLGRKRKMLEEEEAESDVEFTPNVNLLALDRFIQSVKERVGFIKDKEPFKLPEMAMIEYPFLELPKSLEEISKISQIPPPASIRTIPIDNFIKKIEEYILETERRKRPHTTKLSIYQRNGMDSYFGELEMESFLESPPGQVPTSQSQVKPVGLGVGGFLAPPTPTTATTKCQFELGSSRSVALYVKQFSDIFTEDGRRPCKITYQKVGQPAPQVLYTNSYNKTAGGTTPTSAAAAGSNASPTTPSASSQSSSATPTITMSSSSVPSQPPVQIVHPQPRTVTVSVQQNQPQTVTLIDSNNQNQLFASASSSSSSSSSTSASSQSVTFNLNAAPQQQQQVLTRPQIVSVNLQSQSQQPGQQILRPTTAAQQQQLLQQRLLRLKQQQLLQQQQQLQQQQNQNQPQTALAKLLLANMSQQQQQNTGSVNNISRPITVAVQPQPSQKVTASGTTVEVPQQQQQQQIMIQTSNSNSVQNSLNTITLDGLLNAGNAGNTNAINSMSLGQNRGVNILRVGGVNNSSVGQSQNQTMHQLLQRQLASGNVILGGQPGQRILINANSGQQIGNITLSGGGQSGGGFTSISDEEVNSSIHPDLSSLLQQQQTLMATTTTPPTQESPQQHNLNLNLNLNLNGVTGEGGGQQLQGTSQGPPPFLVFISPLRSVPVSMSSSNTSGNAGGSNLNRQVSVGGGSSLASALQHHQQNQNQLQNALGGENAGSLGRSISRDSPMEVGVDSIFNALSEAIGPELGSKLDVGGGTASVMIGNMPYTVSVSSAPSESQNVICQSVGSKKDGSVITLSDLLGNSNSNHPSMSAILNASSPSPSTVSSTPRLSALLAGTPSADATRIGTMNNTLNSLGSPTDSGSTLLERLTASGGGGSRIERVGGGVSGSGLNPIATATPSVVLEHPMLAATLTGSQQSPRGVSAYRQIAPAPTGGGGGVNRKH